MLAAYKRAIQNSPLYIQVIAWPGYFALWVIAEATRGLWWIATHLYHDATHALGTALRPLLVPAALVTLVVVLYYAAPGTLSAFIQVGIVLGLCILALRVAARGLFKTKKKSGNGH